MALGFDYYSHSCRALVSRVFLIAFLSGGGVYAHTIQWGGSILDRDLLSKGELVTATFTFEIGTIGQGFEPTANNLSLIHI